MADRNAIPTKLFWVDLEMTGLNPNDDVILEIAAEITDFNFKTLASYEARIKHPRELVAGRMQLNSWWQQYPHNRDEFLNKLEEGKDLKLVEQELIDLVSQQFGSELVIMAGNSIWNDRLFVKQWWPALDVKLHYRMLDVSSFKIVMQGKFGEVFEKKEVHRAFDDIQASIAELQSYLDRLQKNEG